VEDVAKYLFEFHEMRPAREALKMAIATGSPGVIRLVWGWLPEADHEHRYDLLHVAAEFACEAALAWLFRDSGLLEREAFAAFAIRGHLGWALRIAVRNGLRPWSRHCRQIQAVYWPGAELAFARVPEGVTGGVGWWVNGCGAVVPLPSDKHTLSLDGIDMADLTELAIPVGVQDAADFGRVGLLSGCSRLHAVSLPPGMVKLWDAAFLGCTGLRLVTLPRGLNEIGTSAFRGCSSLVVFRLPSGVTTIGLCAFHGCASLPCVTIPAGVTVMSPSVFDGCIGLRWVRLPPGIIAIEGRAFAGCSNLRRLTIPAGVKLVAHDAFTGLDIRRLDLLGPVIATETVAALESCLTLGASRIVSGELAGQQFGSIAVVAETNVRFLDLLVKTLRSLSVNGDSTLDEAPTASGEPERGVDVNFPADPRPVSNPD
jgi:hypothetical protein